MRSIEARLDGLRGVFRALAEHHAEVATLIDRVLEHPSRRRELWPRVRVEILSHERAEVREVYPVLRQRQATRALADHHDDDAQEIEQLIDQLDRLDVDTDAWGVVFAQLADLVSVHARDEERGIFPAAQAALGEALVDELTVHFLATRQQIAEAV